MTPTPTLPISAENKSVAGACPLRLPAIPVTLAVPKLVVPAVEFHFFFLRRSFLCVRIAPARREVPHSHPAFQWGPGRLFHRDGARVLIDSAPLDDRTATVQLAPLISWPQCLSYDDLERTAVRSKKVLVYSLNISQICLRKFSGAPPDEL